SDASGNRLDPVEGQPPSLVDPPSGCKFHPRCPFTMSRCRDEEPTLLPVEDRLGRRDTTSSAPHESACWLPADIVGMDEATDEARFTAAAAGTTRSRTDRSQNAEEVR